MTTNFVEIIDARLTVEATDAVYGVQFFKEILSGKTWEFDRMSDAVGQTKKVEGKRMRVVFNPVESSMKFPEDAARGRAYVMSVEAARRLYAKLRDEQTQYWFALDTANIAETFA